MAVWSRSIVTNAGKEIIQRSQVESKKITFTNAKSSSKVYEEDEIDDLTELEDVKQTFLFAGKVYENNSIIKLIVNMDNENLITGYKLNTLGIFAHIENESDILFAISITSDGDDVPKATDGLWQHIVNNRIALSTTENITVVVDKTACATIEYVDDITDNINTEIESINTILNTHTSNNNNPHNVTKTQVGLSNVPNVTTNNQTPTFTIPLSLSALVSGETLTILLGKIAKGISDLISHLNNTSNPHSITKSQVGLGNVANTGDSATPVSGGTTKFTTGGAYTELAKKINISDIINNLTSTATNKPLSAAQGKALNDNKVPNTRTVNGKALSSNITLTKSDISLGNVDNVKQYSASNPPPYPVTKVGGLTGSVQIGSSLRVASNKLETNPISAGNVIDLGYLNDTGQSYLAGKTVNISDWNGSISIPIAYWIQRNTPSSWSDGISAFSLGLLSGGIKINGGTTGKIYNIAIRVDFTNDAGIMYHPLAMTCSAACPDQDYNVIQHSGGCGLYITNNIFAHNIIATIHINTLQNGVMPTSITFDNNFQVNGSLMRTMPVV